MRGKVPPLLFFATCHAKGEGEETRFPGPSLTSKKGLHIHLPINRCLWRFCGLLPHFYGYVSAPQSSSRVLSKELLSSLEEWSRYAP
uniref:Uncharacterized protein n=1 Tax=Vitis vinifera TaxID=29760 RepID=F6HS89_VITVI